jgi:hypothetical protein
MTDVTYRETRIIRPHTDDTIRIEVTAKCDSMTDISSYAKYLHIQKKCAYVVCDDILYFLEGRLSASYLVSRVVNI